MNRIVFAKILSSLFLSTALLAQNPAQRPKTEPKPTATEPKPVAPNGASTTGPGGLPLRGYKFDVVTVNSSGRITNRRKGQARYYVEDISGVALEMAKIPGGTFLMGTSEAEANQVKREYERNGYNAEVASKESRWEVPQHTVSVPTFYMGKFEVTQAQWRAVLRLPKVNRDLVGDRSHYKGDSLPVEQVSWEDAIEFCARLSRATGRTYRLPTEAEWEYAARGGTSTAFYFGETITPELVNYNGNNPYGSAPKGTYRQTTTPVGSLGYPNAFGLYDMHGNVFEWCMDYWHESYKAAPTDGSSWETGGDSARRVLRGGSDYHDANHSRAAMRVAPPATMATPSTGLRVVAVAPKLPAAALDVEDAPTLYLARVIFVDPANRDAYVRWLERSQRAVWQQLKRRGYLADETVFEVDKVLSGSEVPTWNFLLLAHIASGVTAPVFLQAEREAEREVERSTPHDGAAADSVPVKVRRVDVLRSTPNSYYPVPEVMDAADAEFVIEYIAVQTTQAALDEYRETMRVSIGPVVGEHMRNGTRFSFIALETVSVEFAEAGMPNWNQIHVRGGLPDDPIPWPSTLAAAYRKLDSIRTKPRIDLSHAIRQLAVR